MRRIMPRILGAWQRKFRHTKNEIVKRSGPTYHNNKLALAINAL